MAGQGQGSSRRAYRRVLVIYAEPVTRAFISKTLRTSDVADAEDQASALTMLANSDPRFDVVIVECRRAKERRAFPCIELVHTMFRRWPWIPVILVTAAQEIEGLRPQVLLSGVRQLLRRPLRAVDLAASVEAVLRRRGRRAPGGPRTIATIKRVFSYLDEQLGDIPTLRELATRAAMSRSHFSRTFHAVAGMPLRDYLRDLRLKRARELLLTSKLSLTAVAVESGFYDLPHFDKAFRQRLGMSPQKFRAGDGAGATAR